MARIADKRQMYELQRRGALGNYLRSWAWREFVESGIHGSFGLRVTNAQASPLFKRGLDRDQMLAYGRRLMDRGAVGPKDFVISEDSSLVDEYRTLQGEATTVGGLRVSGLLFASSGKIGLPVTCREEMRQPDGVVEVGGLMAKSLLDVYLCERSREWMDELLKEYPDAVVEFSSFSVGVGAFGWNTIFWEVRNY